MKALSIAFIFVSLFAKGQLYTKEQKLENTLYSDKAGQCAPPTSTTMLSLNNVKAMIHTAGNLWQVPNQNYTQYEIPKNSGRMALFTAALWLGGTDINNQLRLAALRYRNGQDYWTGPLSKVQAETNYDICAKYDKHFVSTQDEIREFNAWYQAGVEDATNGTQTQKDLFPDYKVPNIIKEWPAHGDVSLGQDYYLAPFFDNNEDGQYNWEDGDYPWHDINRTKNCKTDRRVSLFGDINYWWVMNDKGNIHTETGADPIGMEIRAQAFAFSSNDEVNNMTFYNYELINRGTQTLYNTYFGFFTDGALGDPTDDYVGCDVNRGLAYYYNGDNFDGDFGAFKGYGFSPPAVGVDFFEGPFQDDDGKDNAFGIGENEALNGIGYGDGIVDNERFGMRRFLYYSNSTQGADPSQTDPINASDYYNYLRGFWKDGTTFYYGGSGHLSDADANPDVPCDFMFPGNTDPLGWGTDGVPQIPWTEAGSNNPPNDRRFVQSAGPFILKPGAVNNITVGVVYARSNVGSPFESVSVLQRADDKAQALFENCFKVLDGPHAPLMNYQELSNEVILTLSNPINSNNYQEKYSEYDPFIVSADPNADKNYHFQGYQIFQMASKEVSISDIQNPEKARLVAQCDIKDGISRIINFEFDDDLGASIPTEMVDGQDKGIRHSFSVKNDLFAQGNNRLINFKRYYYLAVSYAYNNYKTFVPDDPANLEGQKRLYLASRKAPSGEVKVIEVIPHNPLPEAGGTLHYLEYGSSPEITRLDGTGNGNRSQELTQKSIETIVDIGLLEKPTYKKGAGPIHIKVVDPLNVADGYFECRFKSNSTITNVVDSAFWVITRYVDYIAVDSVSSEQSIQSDNEQIIPQWGISVQILQTNYFGPNGSSFVKSTNFIESSIQFSDSSKRWLGFVKDNDAFFSTNWIRSGTNSPETDPTNPAYECLPDVASYLNPCSYKDEVGVDDEKHFATILGGGIAPHRLVGYQTDFMPMAYFNMTNPGSSKSNASISFLPGIDLVLTQDKSKWTRCPIIELGRDPALNVGNAQSGALRKSQSVNKNGLPDGTGTGMGWFPGYAIDIETGARLYLAFGENSFLGSENGSDMIWNPSSRLVDAIGTPLMGGMHPIYVFSYKQASINNVVSAFDFDAYKPGFSESALNNMAYQKMLEVENNNPIAKRQFYGSISWIAYPILNIGQRLLSSEVNIKLRVNKEYKNFIISGKNGGNPMFSWNMSSDRTIKENANALRDALSIIQVVPNPYNAFSEYENNRLDTRVKITNLPERCLVRIYNSQGKLIKSFKKDSPVTFLDWTLTNHQNIPIASGVYLIHVEVEGVGEIVIKSFVSMRTVDLENL